MCQTIVKRKVPQLAHLADPPIFTDRPTKFHNQNDPQIRSNKIDYTSYQKFRTVKFRTHQFRTKVEQLSFVK